MSQEEKLRRAKLYTDKLASGIDPLSDRVVPQDSVLNQPKMIRYFSFVSEVLEEQLAQYNVINVQQELADNIKSSNSSPLMRYNEKLDFQITRSAIDSVIISNEPIPISNLARRIQNKAEFGGKNFSHRWITNWLVYKGFLYIHEDTHKRIPTTTGTKLGIYQELRPSHYGNLLITLYRKEAQRYVLNNLSEILIYHGCNNSIK